MNTSFVVPTFNEENYLEECLKSIKTQDCEKEVIVVDGSSKDDTIEIAEKYADKIITDIEGRGRSRDRGAEEAKYEIIVFVDADTILEDAFIDRVTSYMNDESLVACGTHFRMTGFRSKIIQVYGNITFPRINPPLLPGFCTVVKTDTYQKSRGFEDIPGEDLQFSKEISEHGKTGVLREKLVVNSGRRIRKYGLTGTLVYYLWKDAKRRIINFRD